MIYKLHIAIGKENHIGTEIAGTWPLKAKCGCDTIGFFKTERDLRPGFMEPCVECFSDEEFTLYLLGNV